MLARALNRSLVRSIRPIVAPRCPTSPARSLLLLRPPLLQLPQLQQSRAFAIKKRRPYKGGDPGAYSEDPISSTDERISPLSETESTTLESPVEKSETTTSTLPPLPPQALPNTPLTSPTWSSLNPSTNPATDLFVRKTTLATGGGGAAKGGDGLPRSTYVSSTDRKRERLARLMFAAFVATVLGGGIYLGRDLSEFEQSIYDISTVPNGWSMSAMYARIKARVQNVLDFYNEPPFEKLLPDPHPDYSRPYTLVIALEDLCVHSTWDREHGWRIAKRPGLDYLLAYMFQYYEIVVFTNQHDQIAAPIIQKMDQYPGYIMYPLFRSHTRYKDGKYIKVYLSIFSSLQPVSSLTPFPGPKLSQPRPFESDHARNKP